MHLHEVGAEEEALDELAQAVHHAHGHQGPPQAAAARISRELQQARRERRYNPSDVDAVLADLDRLILARDRKALTGPSSLWEPK